MAKRIHCDVISVPPQKMPVMPALAMLEPSFSSRLAQGLEQLGRGEHALDVVAGRQDRQGLVDARAPCTPSGAPSSPS